MEKEIFKIFKDRRKDGANGALWEVSNYGNVRKNGDVYIQSEKKDGYLGFGRNYYVHRAVAELFVPNPLNKPTVDHINRDRRDNRACNLRWATMKEQSANRDNEANSKIVSKLKIGNKNTLGKVWISNPTTEHSTLINPSQLTDYLAKGYIRGRKIKK